MLKHLQEKNRSLSIYDITDTRFSKFGRVLPKENFEDAITYLSEKTEVPNDGNKYIAHDSDFLDFITTETPYQDVFGNMKLQFGYVNGHNQKLNSLEYHKSSEINIAASSFVLLLGLVEDITNNTYQSSNLTAFYIPKGTVFEIYPRTLHFSPCEVNKTGFKCGVILPYSTNMSFIQSKTLKQNEDRLLFKTNKWLLAHEEHQTFITKGAHKGIQGINYKINY